MKTNIGDYKLSAKKYVTEHIYRQIGNPTLEHMVHNQLAYDVAKDILRRIKPETTIHRDPMIGDRMEYRLEVFVFTEIELHNLIAEAMQHALDTARES